MANIKVAILTVIDMMKDQGEPLPTEPAKIRELIEEVKTQTRSRH